ncbi:MAG: cytochrome C [Gammaproteobacteria bacterium]|nr:MAG: cytochrome C [Gammaproteobacteria bacterium]
MNDHRVLAWTLVLLLILALPRIASAVPSFARQTGMPCSQCHTLSFGPALTPYGRQFKLNGYTFGEGEHPMPLAFMVQGGFSHTDVAPPADAQPAHFAPNNNVSVDQVSVFLATRLTEHIGMFSQSTYSGEDRHFSWDNTDIRYARPLKLFGTDAVVGISVNNNPTVQDLWHSSPAWAYPYIGSPLVPGIGAAPVIGGLGGVVAGATAYTMIHDHVYLEAGAYKGLSDRWLGNVGLYPDNNVHINGAAPYWRAAYQFTTGARGEHYFSVGTFGMDVKMQPDVAVPDTDHYTDVALDATYQYTPEGPGAILVNASLIHEKQQLNATFNAGGSANATNHLNALEIDASYAYRQTWSAGLGLFDTSGSRDQTFDPVTGTYGGLYTPAAFSGSNSGTPDTRGATMQFECVPLGKMQSWGRPWVNLRVGLQYTAYLRFNGGTSNYDGFGRSASQNNSLFLFSWMAF